MSGPKVHISSYQLVALLFTTVIVTAVLYLPQVAFKEAGRDAWASGLLATVGGLVVVAPTTMLATRFPRRTVTEYAPDIIGRLPGKALGVGLASFLVHANSMITREFSELITSTVLTDTPVVVSIIMIVVLAAYATYLGIEVVARASEVVVFLMFLPIPLAMFPLAQKIDPHELAPVLAYGLGPAARGALPILGWMAELSLLLFLVPNLKQPRRAPLLGTVLVLSIGAALLPALTIPVTVFGAEEAARLSVPLLSMARDVSVAGFYERIDAVIIALWVSGSLVKISVFYYAAVLTLSQTFNVRRSLLIPPVAAVLIVLAVLVFESSVELVDFIEKVWGPYALTMGFGIPALLLALAVARGKRDAP